MDYLIPNPRPNIKKFSVNSNHMKKYLIPDRSFMDTKRCNEVTFLSKTLAAVLFILLPFAGFLLGVVTMGGDINSVFGM